MVQAPRFWHGLWVVALLWFATLFIVNPAGNFPIGDDWSFGLSVQNLIVHHDYHPVGWAAMSLLTNVLWGSLFCLPVGFSFTALRVSSLAAALLGIGGTYWLAKQARQPSWIAMLTALTLGFSPIYYELSNTFMTDVTFTALVIFSALFLLKHLQDGGDSDLVIGTIFAVLATLSRQLALAVPLAFAFSLMLKQGCKVRSLCRALAPVVVTISLLALFQHWMAATGRLSGLYSEKSQDLAHAITHPLATAPYLAYNAYASLIYLGLFLFPVLLCALVALPAPQKKQILPLFGAALWTILLLLFVFRSHGIFLPLLDGAIMESGFGLRAVYQAHGTPPLPALPPLFWRGATCVGVLGGAGLLAFAAAILRGLALKLLKPGVRDDREIAAGFLLFSAVIYLFPVLATPFFYDRYLLPSVPLLAGAIIYLCPPITIAVDRRITAVAVAVLAALAVTAVCGTRDLLAWNRTRWQALDQLMANDHVKPDQIDGGFEFNGFYLYDPRYHYNGSTRDGWWVRDETYIVTDSLAPGYGVCREYDFSHWMPSYTGRIYVLKRSGPPAALRSPSSDTKTGQD
jgi:hypothetical protein